MTGIVIAYGTTEGHTGKVSECLARVVREYGFSTG